MAYNDYGAFVFCNGERRRDKEDVAVFATDEETFGRPSEDIAAGSRIFVFLEKQKKDGKKITWLDQIHHGILGDGDIRVICHKQGLPEIYERIDGEIHEIPHHIDCEYLYDYDSIDYEYKGYKFNFSGKEVYMTNPYYARMTTPEGDIWECWYDYDFGAGYEDDGITDKENEDDDK